MADSGVYDRWYRTVGGKRVASAEHGQGKRWQARWRDESGRQRKQNHDRRTDAERALAMVKADLHRGVYLDPAAGKVTLGAYAAAWCAAQTFDETTREAVTLRLRLHVVPQLGAYPLAALRPSVVQAWARGLQQQLAPSYVRVVFANLSAILQAAVDDGAHRPQPVPGRVGEAASARPAHGRAVAGRAGRGGRGGAA